ncbi:MAG TPA: hypothetical protein VMW50_08310 [Dehalococcoidia bacterium]|nr:hypothetical protein [Dehalococcoidia bacterium]
MPYIDPERRVDIDKAIAEILNKHLFKGDITYAISKLAHEWVKYACPAYNYMARSEGKSILADALDEYNNAVMNPYENKKRLENGPISELDAVNLEDVR